MDNSNLLSFYRSVDSEKSLKSFISSKTKENLYLEFKQKQDSRNGDLGPRDKFNYSKALSGFANSAGGVLIWGIETSKKNESAKKLKPINQVDDFIRGLKSSLLTSVQPIVDDVLIERISKGNSTSKGYVKCFIPQSDKTPHRAIQADREYFKRSVEGFNRLEHFDLEDMFGRRQRPNLIFSLVTKKYENIESEVTKMVFYMQNQGRAVAKHFGFFVKFEGNIILIETPNSSIQNISSLNDMTPTLSYTNDIGVIHPNGISTVCGDYSFKKVNNKDKIKGTVTYFCENMSSQTKNIEIE